MFTTADFKIWLSPAVCLLQRKHSVSKLSLCTATLFKLLSTMHCRPGTELYRLIQLTMLWSFSKVINYVICMVCGVGFQSLPQERLKITYCACGVNAYSTKSCGHLSALCCSGVKIVWSKVQVAPEMA